MARKEPFSEYRYTTKEERIRIRKELAKWQKTPSYTKWLAQMIKWQFGTCFYCDLVIDINNRATFHIEHRVPVYYGGTNELRNLCLACPSCNYVKGTQQLVRKKKFLEKVNHFRVEAQERSGRPIKPKLYI